MKIFILLFAVFLITALSTAAQPVLSRPARTALGTQADLYLINDSLATINSTGADVQWDGSTLKITKAGTYEAVDPKSTPYASNFSNSNLAYKRSINGLGTTYTYFIDSSTELNALGDEIGGSKPVVWKQYDKIVQYPFHYLDSFATTRQTSVDPAEEFVRTYDAYGTLRMNNKVYNNVVRIKKNNGNALWLLTSPVTFPVLIQVGSNNTLLYIEPTNIVDAVDDLRATAAGCKGSDNTVVILPCPAIDNALIQLQGREILEEIGYFVFDNVGRMVLSGVLYGNNGAVSTTTLESGVYQVQLRSTTGELIAHSPLAIQH